MSVDKSADIVGLKVANQDEQLKAMLVYLEFVYGTLLKVVPVENTLVFPT